MTTATVAAPFPRTAVPAAPAAGAPPRARGFFAVASTSLRGLPGAFWILQAYLFLSVAVIDEEWQRVGKLRPRLVLGTMALAAAFVSAAMARAGERARPFGRRSTNTWLAAFAVAGFLSSMVAIVPSVAVRDQIEHLTKVLGYALLVAIVRTRRELLVTVLVFAAGYGFYVLRSFTEYLSGKYDFQMGVVRMLGAGTEYSDPNSFAATLVFALPLVAWAGIHTRSWFLRFCTVCYGALAAVCVVYTHSRSGLALLALASLYVLRALPGARSKTAFVMALGVVVAVMAARQSRGALDRYASILSSDTYRKDESTRGRLDGYRVGWRIASERPLLGAGPGCWSVYRQRRVDGEKLLPHNLPGLLIAERGALGAITWAGYLGSVLAFAFAERRRRAGSPRPWDRTVQTFVGAMLATLGLHLVSGLAAHNLDRPGWTWAGALILVAATCRSERGDPDPDPEPAPAHAGSPR